MVIYRHLLDFIGCRIRRRRLVDLIIQKANVWSNCAKKTLKGHIIFEKFDSDISRHREIYRILANIYHTSATLGKHLANVSLAHFTISLNLAKFVVF